MTGIKNVYLKTVRTALLKSQKLNLTKLLLLRKLSLTTYLRPI